MNLTQEDWLTRLNEDSNGVVLDVRTEDEWNDGIIPNAVMIDIYKGQEFLDEVETLDKSKTYYVYCKAGGRSQQACQLMEQMGFETTYNLMGGFTHYKGEVAFPE